MSPSPAEVQTRSASQNDRLNLSFVTELKVVSKKSQKWSKNSVPMEDDICTTFLKSLWARHYSMESHYVWHLKLSAK